MTIEKRRHIRYTLNCEIWVETKKLINGLIVNISKSGVKIKLVDTIKEAEFYKNEIDQIHNLEFSVDEFIKVEIKSKLVRVESKEKELFLCYEFIHSTNILDYIFSLNAE